MNRLLSLAFATLLSEDLACIAAGALVASGDVRTLDAIAACAVGIYAGDLGLWLAGRVLGARVLAWPRVSTRLPAGGPARFEAWFDQHARVAILGSRFAPGTRLPLYLAAGACRTSFFRFAIWSAVAAAAWTPVLVGVTAIAGEHVSERIAATLAVGRWGSLIAVLFGLVFWSVGRRVVNASASLRARQRLAAAIARVWRWEFWPMCIFYAPVCVWIAWLALRHGGYRTLTAANPGMPDGGVVGESKFEILSRLPAGVTIPAALIDAGAPQIRMAAVEACVRDRGWTFPLIMKPNVGQRGTGVRLVPSIPAAADYLASMPARVVVQPYHPGPFEAGVFYYRRPGEARGRILAITDKHFPEVTGDGQSSIEDLVWSHPRYRMQAGTFLARLGDRRDDIPASGARVPLGIAGNHAQGTMFTDGLWMKTAALEERIDAIARRYPGFFIGRYDIRYADRAAFMAGRDLAIVELNGATAECTNVYDPQGSLAAAYRLLFLQWRLVFEIGAENRRLGARATTRRRLFELLRQHLTATTPFAVSD
jgi:membrane protein DedA with SNARE-associated domain